MRNAFALLYVLLLVALISITILAIGTSTTSDLRQAKKSTSNGAVYQVALSALEKVMSSSCTLGGPHNIGADPKYGQYTIKACSPAYEVQAVYQGSKLGLKYDNVTKTVQQIGN